MERAKSKIWIYLSDKEFDTLTEKMISERTELFLRSWKAHENPLSSFFKIYKNRFLVIGVDEQEFSASGCSIDKQLKFIQDLEKELQLQLLNRLLVAYESGDKIEVVSQSKIRDLIDSQIINHNTRVYNNAISSLNELETNWLIPIQDSWLNKYFKQ